VHWFIEGTPRRALLAQDVAVVILTRNSARQGRVGRSLGVA
jgi:hypothetical protein